MSTPRRNHLERIAGYLAAAAGKSAQHHREAKRHLARVDLFYLLVFVLGRRDINRDWLFERCIEVHAGPDGFLDLWAREHYKSTIITYGKTIQDILINPNVTIGVFSHTRPIAKGFLRQIKREFEDNEMLRSLFDDVVWEKPQAQAPKWSEDDGLIVQRSQNPKEATVEAWGLVDGMPTGKHFNVLVYDDVVTEKSVTNPDMIKKTTDAWSLSLNLGAHGGARRIIGTRYHFNDTYKTVLERGAAVPRVYPATADGKEDGDPVFLTKEQIRTKRRDQGPYIFGCQMLQNPKSDRAQGFDLEWLRPWSGRDWTGMNLYILVDPSSGKKEGDRDYTTMQVIGLGEDENYYWIDGLRDRMNLTQRGAALMRLHREYRPKAVGYEQYGMQADIEYIKTLQEDQNYRFEIKELKGPISKADRIRRLVPVMEEGRFYMPPKCQHKTTEETVIDVVDEFRNELDAFPVGGHDDLIDGAARILDGDLGAIFPSKNKPTRTSPLPTRTNSHRFNPHRRAAR